MKQMIINCQDNYNELSNYLKKYDKLFIVATKSLNKLSIGNFFDKLKIKKYYFTDFVPNPTYESVVLGIDEYKKYNSPLIIAIGGGSAIDVAKCIKLYASMDGNYLEKEIIPNKIDLLAIPTTAGTGSEATCFAVIYRDGKKISIESKEMLPKVVVFDSNTLDTLPIYQRKATMLDALSHSIESYWSVNANSESKKYSLEALKLIIDNIEQYLNNKKNGNINMLKAANIAGKAINISKTTAGHALCYKLTSLYGISHGHAAALVNASLYPFMINYLDNISDKKKKDNLYYTFKELANALGFDRLEDSKNYFKELLTKLDLYDIKVDYKDIDTLKKAVNIMRLKNNPIELTDNDIEKIYDDIFKEVEKRKKICK